MILHYNIPSMGQLRRELLTVVEAHSSSNGIDDERALRDVFMCLVREMRIDGGYSADQLGMLLILAMELETTKGE